jgi:hypothetical protein
VTGRRCHGGPIAQRLRDDHEVAAPVSSVRHWIATHFADEVAREKVSPWSQQLTVRKFSSALLNFLFAAPTTMSSANATERIPMSHVTILNKSQLFAAATAISAVGFLTAPAPALADRMFRLAPACTQYGFNGEFPIRGGNGWTVSFTSTGSAAGGPAVLVFDDHGTAHGNVIRGGIQGRSVDFEILWNDGKPDNRWVFVGNVSDDGRVHDGAEFLRVVGEGQSSWKSTRSLECIDPVAPPPVVPVGKVHPATVKEPVDVYDGPDGTQYPDVFLPAGSSVDVLNWVECPNGWCHVEGPNVPAPNARGWVWGPGFLELKY